MLKRFYFSVCIGKPVDPEPVATIKCHEPDVIFGVRIVREKKISPWRKIKEPYPIPEGAVAYLRVKRPDRAYTVTETTINADGVIVCQVHPYSVATPGKCVADVSLYDRGEKFLTSASFVFCVDAECVCDFGDDDPVYFDTVQNLLKTAEDAARRAQDAAERAESAGGQSGEGGQTQTDRVSLKDVATGRTYTVYVEGGKLTMNEESEGKYAGYFSDK